MAHDPRTVEVPEPVLAAARNALENHGPNRGAKLLGVSRNALLAMLATGHAMPGTVALVEQKSGVKAA